MSAKRLLFCLLAFALFAGALCASPGHSEGIEPITAKEYIELSLAPIKESINWIKWGMAAMLTLMLGLGGLMTYLHSDIKANMKEQKTDTDRRFAEQKADMNRLFAEQKTDTDRRFTEQKADTDRHFDKMDKRFDKMDKRFDKIESLLQKQPLL